MKIDKSIDLIKNYGDYLFGGVDLVPNILEKGKGSFVWDVDGNKILDLNAGQFCSVFGHSWSGLIKIISKQTKRICHTNTAVITKEVLFAARDVSNICTNMNGKVIFLSTGSEAVECALRFAKNIKQKSGFICFDSGYHGLTLGSQSVTFGGKWAVPVVENIYSVSPMNSDISSGKLSIYLEEVELLLKKNIAKIAGFIMEPIISVGGMFFLSKEYCEGIYNLCKKYDIFLIYDECQTGMGRTGEWFCYQHFNLVPDILISAKGIGLGLPVSMVVFNQNTVKLELKINNFSSHQNDPLSAVLVSGVINEIKNKSLMMDISSKGKYLLDKLNGLSKKYSFIKNPRGMGLMLGFDIYKKGIDSYREMGNFFLSSLLKNGIMLQSTSQGRTYRLLPNYNITYEEIDFFIEKVELVVKEMVN